MCIGSCFHSFLGFSYYVCKHRPHRGSFSVRIKWLDHLNDVDEHSQVLHVRSWHELFIFRIFSSTIYSLGTNRRPLHCVVHILWPPSTEYVNFVVKLRIIVRISYDLGKVYIRVHNVVHCECKERDVPQSSLQEVWMVRRSLIWLRQRARPRHAVFVIKWGSIQRRCSQLYVSTSCCTTLVVQT